MYELFLTALIEDSDFPAACAVLTGVCGMKAWETTQRVLYFQGPTGKPVGLFNQKGIEKPSREWKDLHTNLCRQSFILQARFDLQDYKTLPKDGGGHASRSPILASNLDSSMGILRWTDFPDPPHGRPVLTQRKKVEIWDVKKLPTILKDNNYQFKTETVEDTYRFFRDDIEFCLMKHYFAGPIADYALLENRQGTFSNPSSNLPSWKALTGVDAQGRWVLHIKAHVVEDNKPDVIRKAQDRLMGIRGELEGVFNFRSIDRKVHDTRVAQQQQGVQVLPQKVGLNV